MRKVTEGKIFVELEFARLARMLAKIKEDAGEVVEAAGILQEVSVETCGSMEAREKAEFMLEQVRLCLAKKDWVRSRILSKKIKRSVLTEQGFHDLKLKHCRLSSQLSYHENDMLSLADDFSRCSTHPRSGKQARWRSALQRVALFGVLAPFGKDQADLLQRTYREKKMGLLPPFKTLLERFTADEIVHWKPCMFGSPWPTGSSQEVSGSKLSLKRLPLSAAPNILKCSSVVQLSITSSCFKFYSEISYPNGSAIVAGCAPSRGGVIQHGQ